MTTYYLVRNELEGRTILKIVSTAAAAKSYAESLVDQWISDAPAQPNTTYNKVSTPDGLYWFVRVDKTLTRKWHSDYDIEFITTTQTVSFCVCVIEMTS
jgi:hypothetical protein